MMVQGGCLCGAVRFELAGPIRDVIACHCNQCRKTSGHYVAATRVPAEALKIVSDEGLRWFQSSGDARRGFCERCGSSLFWEQKGSAGVSVHAGTLEAPTGLGLAEHIFVGDKGDYYEIAGAAG
jgi:hypothetical protein